MIEEAPKFSDEEIIKRALVKEPLLEDLITAANNNYEYWDTVKYKKTPNGYTAKDLWFSIKASRMMHDQKVWKKYGIHFSLTNRMQEFCHQFDMNFGPSLDSNSLIKETKEERYLISSLMEEAISSSQMEGASTTRKVAKEMLRKKRTPKDKSQQMIHNNYQTIQYIVDNKSEPLTSERLLKIHRLITDNTLDESDTGRFREDDNVVVENGITHEVVHTPPSYKDIPQFIEDLCDFFNNKNPTFFIHPVIKGIIIHFMIAYMHPFVDGNGRTARAMFYWYMLKEEYSLTEYLSISRIISRRKKKYEKTFLYSEADNLDIGYFITYNLSIIETAFEELKKYIERKIEEKNAAYDFLTIGNINERQAQLLKMYADDPKLLLTVKDLEIKFSISPTTAKSDINGLLDLGLLTEFSFNKVKKGYRKSVEFDDIIKNKLTPSL
ncbi:Fic family protein [Porphyromonadaceae bacterium W3.11]|nr:Fic family protein [Porphyromonadaceae bacterium W3.11]